MENPTISIIIPCFNEEKFIEGVIQNILEQNFPMGEMEVLFLDGRSTDNTAKIIQKHIDAPTEDDQEKLSIQLIDNPYRFVPQGMNLGIQNAKGNLIIRLDAHAAYPKNYIRDLYTWQKKLDADNVGGIWRIKPRSHTLKARAIAKTLAHPMAVGNALYRLGVKQPMEVDTVPFGCFPKSTFEKYGNYNTRLHRNQDIELNKRIIRGGGKIFLIPEVECTYFARDTFRSLWKNNFDNGKWVILTAWITRTLKALSIRHFVPLGFFIYLIFCLLLLIKILISGWISWMGILFCPLILYFSLIVFFSFQMSFKEKNIGMFPYFVLSFLTLHISYGAGSIDGFFSIKKY